MSIFAAGVLPYTFYLNQLHFLVGREHKEEGWTGSNKLSDFGGAVEAEHKNLTNLSKFSGTATDYPKYTAATEFWEETMGLFYNTQELFNMLKTDTTITYNNGGYAEHLMYVDYDPFWVDLFVNGYNYVLSCAKPSDQKIGYMYIPSCPKGFTEKTEIKWVSYAHILELLNNKSHPDLSNYRPEFLNTLRKMNQANILKTLSDKANIFNKSVAPTDVKLMPEPILIEAKDVKSSTTKPFYPTLDEIKDIGPTDKYIGSDLSTMYKYLFKQLISQLSINSAFTSAFDYIDHINQAHFAIKKLIYLKINHPIIQTTDNHKAYEDGFKKLWNETKTIPIITKAVNQSLSYCPTRDLNVMTSAIGEGSYGAVTEITPAKYNDELKIANYVVKTVNNAALSQLSDIPLEVDSPVIKTKITNIFATEIAALSIINSLPIKSICYNFPYFYGAYTCNENKQMYIYMQKIDTSLDKVTSSSPMTTNDWDNLTLQGIMSLFTLYSIKMTHGDINVNNIGFNQTDMRQPVYQYNGQFYLGKPSNKVFYFIDYGMAFIKDQLEPQSRIDKDKTRMNDGVNWIPTVKDPNSVLGSIVPAFAYKGYYVPGASLANAATHRRQLLDFYLFAASLPSKYKHLFTDMINVFANPVSIGSKNVMPELLKQLLGKLIETDYVNVVSNEELKKIDPNTLRFLGNIPKIE